MPQYLILANDFTDANALTRRMAAREDHLSRMRNEKTAGIFIIGGARLSTDDKMIGSMLIVELENIEAVQKWLEPDPYVQGKVWEKWEITPFRIAPV